MFPHIWHQKKDKVVHLMEAARHVPPMTGSLLVYPLYGFSGIDDQR